MRSAGLQPRPGPERKTKSPAAPGGRPGRCKWRAPARELWTRLSPPVFHRYSGCIFWRLQVGAGGLTTRRPLENRICLGKSGVEGTIRRKEILLFPALKRVRKMRNQTINDRPHGAMTRVGTGASGSAWGLRKAFQVNSKKPGHPRRSITCNNRGDESLGWL